MQETDADIGSEQRFEVCISEKEAREMEDVLMRSMSPFYRRAYRYLGNAADAEDAVQDALLSVCRHLEQFKGESKIVDLVDHHCHQFRSDAIAKTGTPDPHVA
jgi:hypothetical protein